MPIKRQLTSSKAFCCNAKRRFRKLTIACYNHRANTCLIEPDRPFFLHENGTYSVCEKCFKTAKKQNRDGRIEIFPDQCDPTNDDSIFCALSKFEPEANNEEPDEPRVICSICNQAAHCFCVLADPESDYTCPKCRPDLGGNEDFSVYKLSSRLLYCCPLAHWIQKKVDSYIEEFKKSNKKSKKSKESFLPVRVRVVSSHWKTFKVKEWISKMYRSVIPEGYNYQSKAICAFQEQPDGTEICFFALLVAEYDDQCAIWSSSKTDQSRCQNSRHLYISYLDTVAYFQPSSVRRGVYYSIILGYLEYSANCGYESAYLWAQPPQKGDDYIFYAHPASQSNKYLSMAKLTLWYKNLLDQGLEEQIISHYTDLSHQAILESRRIQQFPYFDGDFWPTFLEETICALATEVRDDQGNISNPTAFAAQLNEKAAAEFLSRKLSTFFVHLKPRKGAYGKAGDDASEKGAIFDFCTTVPCEIFETRDNLLGFFRLPDSKLPKLRCEFSDIKRAKFSTHLMLKEILKSQQTSTIVAARRMLHSLSCKSISCDTASCPRFRKLMQFSAQLPAWHPVSRIKSPHKVYLSLAFTLMAHHGDLCPDGCKFCDPLLKIQTVVNNGGR